MMAARPQAQDFGRVAVLYGGWSAERDVSLVSGRAAFEALQARDVDAHLVDATPDVVLGLKAAGFDRVFIALHGRGGEDGRIQSVLELLGLPYTGCRPAAAALSMDKAMTKRVWRAEGLPTPASMSIQAGFDAQAVVDELGLPLFVKPVCEGSSIGMSRVDGAEQLPAAFELAAQYDDEVLVERFVDGEEYTATILRNQALPLVCIRSQAEFYDYHAKYQSEDTQYQCPADLSAETTAELQVLCLRAFQVLGLSEWGRVDFFIDRQGQPCLIEANTVPGLTSHSLAPMAAAAAGMDFEECIWQILCTSLEGQA